MAFSLAGLASGVEIASGIKGLSGGSSYKSWHGRSDARNSWYNLSGDLESKNHYDAVRRGAESAGFNPLTALNAGAPSGGFGGSSGGAPALASAEILSGGLRSLDDELSGENARRKQANQLEIDLGKLKLETMRAALAGPSAADTVGLGPSTFGRRATTAVQTAGTVSPKVTFGAGDNLLARGRQKDIGKVTNTPFITEIENALTGDRPVSVPGADGEVAGIDEVATMLLIGGPQAVYNHMQNAPKGFESMGRDANKVIGSAFSGFGRWLNGSGVFVRRPADNAFTRRNQKPKNQQSK